MTARLLSESYRFGQCTIFRSMKPACSSRSTFSVSFLIRCESTLQNILPGTDVCLSSCHTMSGLLFGKIHDDTFVHASETVSLFYRNFIEKFNECICTKVWVCLRRIRVILSSPGFSVSIGLSDGMVCDTAATSVPDNEYFQCRINDVGPGTNVFRRVPYQVCERRRTRRVVLTMH